VHNALFNFRVHFFVFVQTPESRFTVKTLSIKPTADSISHSLLHKFNINSAGLLEIAIVELLPIAADSIVCSAGKFGPEMPITEEEYLHLLLNRLVH
jgi:hypothetical protein